MGLYIYFVLKTSREYIRKCFEVWKCDIGEIFRAPNMFYYVFNGVICREYIPDVFIRSNGKIMLLMTLF